MDHSVQAYLKRLSTEKLETALAYYLQENQVEDHSSEIKMILAELERRYVPEESTPQQLLAWENFLRKRKSLENGKFTLE